MPWTASGAMGFGARHNHKLTAAQSGKAALQANAILKKTGDEGLAIAVANKRFQHRDAGGEVPDAKPTTATEAPINRQAIGNFDTMTPEQLQEMALRLKGSPQGALAQQMLARKRIMNSDDAGQATGAPTTYALGGTLGKGRVHFEERAAPAPSGLLHTTGPGRTDNLKIQPHADSYVLPADVVSGLGEGNTLAGAKQMDMALHSGPHGIQMPQARPRKMGFGANPSKGFGLASGGTGPHKVDIIAAGGEYVVSPEKCAEIGGGKIKRGHKILDDFVLHVRKMTIKEMSKLKGPVKA